jgi:hypothetical protein
MAKKLAWSFSALSIWETCKKKFYHLKVVKDIRDSDSEASQEGKYIHDAMFKYVIKNVKLPIRLKPYERVADMYKERGKKVDDIQGELKLCLNDEFQPVDWFADDAWVRAVLDLLLVKGNIAILVDWKTGKKKVVWDQLMLSAAILSRYMPEIEEFHLVFEWLRDSTRSVHRIHKSELKAVWLKFLPIVNEIEEARRTTEFPASSSGLCGWCPVVNCPHWFDKDDR